MMAQFMETILVSGRGRCWWTLIDPVLCVWSSLARPWCSVHWWCYLRCSAIIGHRAGLVMSRTVFVCLISFVAVSSESPAAGVRGAAEWHWSWRRRPLALVISHDPSLPPDQRPGKEISITAGITKCRDSWGIVRDNWKSRKEISW